MSAGEATIEPRVASALDPATRAEALSEYHLVQVSIREYDNRSFQIKSWSVTVVSASAGAALTQNTPALFGLGALAALAFWVVDALWKSFQVVWINRGTELEELLNGESSEVYSGPRIHESFHKRFKSPISWLQTIWCMRRAAVFLPHFPVAVALGLVCWSAYHWVGLTESLNLLGR